MNFHFVYHFLSHLLSLYVYVYVCKCVIVCESASALPYPPHENAHIKYIFIYDCKRETENKLKSFGIQHRGCTFVFTTNSLCSVRFGSSFNVFFFFFFLFIIIFGLSPDFGGHRVQVNVCKFCHPNWNIAHCQHAVDSKCSISWFAFKRRNFHSPIQCDEWASVKPSQMEMTYFNMANLCNAFCTSINR